jgi:transcriptional regulator with XRE-family HTH domain
MFWTVFYALCTQNGEKPNNVAQKLNISSGVVTKWKNGSTPNVDALIKLSNYYCVSIDYLLGRTNIPNYNQPNNAGNIVNGYNGNYSPLTIGKAEQPEDEMQKEISSVLSGLSFRERTELMTMIYKFADEHNKD